MSLKTGRRGVRLGDQRLLEKRLQIKPSPWRRPRGVHAGQSDAVLQLQTLASPGGRGAVTHPSVKWTQTAWRGSRVARPLRGLLGSQKPLPPHPGGRVEASLGNQVTRSWTQPPGTVSLSHRAGETCALALLVTLASGENPNSGAHVSKSPAPAKATGAFP